MTHDLPRPRHPDRHSPARRRRGCHRPYRVAERGDKGAGRGLGAGERRPAGGAGRGEAATRRVLRGKRREFDLRLGAGGTEFQQRVWAELGRIPFGRTISYGELAARIGKPTASRAVGAANGRNPLPVVVPCHRVIGSSGRLVGYGGGLPVKQALLDLERRAMGGA